MLQLKQKAGESGIDFFARLKKEEATTPIVSSIVPNFRRVMFLAGIKCPGCGIPLIPDCARVVGAEIEIICDRCHRSLMVLEPDGSDE